MAIDRDDDYPDRNERDDLPHRPRHRDDYDLPRDERKNGVATAALVLGVLSLCGGLTAIPGLVCGVIGMSRASSRGGVGFGMAIAGTVLSVVGMLMTIPLMIGLLLPAVQKVREAAARQASNNNLKQISLAQHNYESANDSFPKPYHYQGPAGGEPEKPVDRLSWRVAMLPYLEQENLYKQFRLGEPWNGANNLPLSNQTVKALTHPADTPPSPDSRYRIFYGGGAAYDLNRPCSVITISDGLSNTIAVVEGGERVTWTQFNDYPFRKDGPLPMLGLPDAKVFQAALFDGSVRSFRKTIDPNVLKSAIHASDGVGLPVGE